MTTYPPSPSACSEPTRAILTKTTDYQIAPPDPSGTITSLRSLGYTVEAAVADLVDNSIAAGAQRIWIDVDWNDGDPWVAIIDDGTGMDEATLLTAMRIAGRGPDVERATTDLGRFGLGLKTASFSHARQLVVSSITGSGERSTRAWDLDLVRDTGEWRLLTTPPADSMAILERLGLRTVSHGTTVLWRRLDRTTGTVDRPASNASSETDFHNWLLDLEPHLAMVFHRYLGRRLRIHINDRPITAWDPFQTQYTQTQALPSEQLGDSESPVTVTGYILPQRRYLTDDQYESAGGPRGWLEQQGFYVYRRDRLIVTGGWLGLPTLRVEERCALARIAVEIPAALDHDWAIDVRKSMAIPPVTLNRPLLRLARRYRDEAVKTQMRRVRLATSRSTRDQLGQPWRVSIRPDSVTCSVDRDHPLVRRVTAAAPDPAAVEAMLRLVENTVPVAALRMTHEPDTADPEPFQGVDPTEARAVADQLYAAMLIQGRSPSDARARLRGIEWLQDVAGFWSSDSDNYTQ